MDIQVAFEDFLLAKRADQLKEKTLIWYQSLVSDFVESFANYDLGTITPRQVREYIVKLRNREQRFIEEKQKPIQDGKLSPHSVAAHVRALHVFWLWCEREYNLVNPMAHIKRPPQPRHVPKAVNTSDFVRLLQATGDNDAGRRDRALLMFLADTGCRLGGLLTLRLERLDLGRRQAIVDEKSGYRTVHFTGYTAAILQAWLDVRPTVTTAVFCNMETGQSLTLSGVHMLLKRLKARAGVKGRVNPHGFRHNFAREYLRNGGDLATLAALLGHSQIATTYDFYAIFSEDELAEFHDRYSPVRRIVDENRPTDS